MPYLFGFWNKPTMELEQNTEPKAIEFLSVQIGQNFKDCLTHSLFTNKETETDKIIC